VDYTGIENEAIESTPTDEHIVEERIDVSEVIPTVEGKYLFLVIRHISVANSGSKLPEHFDASAWHDEFMVNQKAWQECKTLEENAKASEVLKSYGKHLDGQL